MTRLVIALCVFLMHVRVLCVGIETNNGSLVRLKDIVFFEGVRDNPVIGYGLVVGLYNTGDDLTKTPYTQESMVSMLDRVGVNVRNANANVLQGTKNTAAVIVTAVLPPFARLGSKMDVRVSSMGTAKSLAGGTLLVTSLMGADGEVYAVAQGPLSVGGYSVSGQSGSSVTKNIPTNARIPSGAIIEKEVPYALTSMKTMRMILRNPDFTTAMRAVEAINEFCGDNVAQIIDSSTVLLQIPQKHQRHPAVFLSNIEQLRVAPDQAAKVVVDESRGIIVFTKDVRISSVAVAQGNLTINIQESQAVSQPMPFTTGASAVYPPAQQGEGQPAQNNGPTVINSPGAQTVTTNVTEINVDEQNNEQGMRIIPDITTLSDLVNTFNALGVAPRDMIMLLESIKAAGALQAELLVQ